MLNLLAHSIHISLYFPPEGCLSVCPSVPENYEGDITETRDIDSTLKHLSVYEIIHAIINLEFPQRKCLVYQFVTCMGVRGHT